MNIKHHGFHMTQSKQGHSYTLYVWQIPSSYLYKKIRSPLSTLNIIILIYQLIFSLQWHTVRREPFRYSDHKVQVRNIFKSEMSRSEAIKNRNVPFSPNRQFILCCKVLRRLPWSLRLRRSCSANSKLWSEYRVQRPTRHNTGHFGGSL